jgi:hypothetical protein
MMTSSKQRCNAPNIYSGIGCFLISIRSQAPGVLLSPKSNRPLTEMTGVVRKTKARHLVRCGPSVCCGDRR